MNPRNHRQAFRALGIFLALISALGGFASPQPALKAQSLETDGSAYLWRVSYDNDSQLNRLASSIDVWEVNHRERYLIALLSADTAYALELSGEEVVFESSLPRWTIAPVTASAPMSLAETIPDFNCYRTTAQLERDMAALAQHHPDLTEWIDIGDSWDKVETAPPAGHDIHALVITNHSKSGPKYRFLIVAEIHARELVTSEIAARFAEFLVANYGSDPDVTWLLDYGEVHIVPLANPDGREYADQLFFWRKNTNSSDGCAVSDPYSGSTYGVDLNRNFNNHWGACESGNCSSDDPCWSTYRGRSPASEPETLALQNYTTSIIADQRAPGLSASAPITTTGLILSLHSFANKVMYPWSWSAQKAPNSSDLKRLGVRLAAPLGYETCQTGNPSCLYQVDGEYTDWAYGKLGVPAYTIEYGTAFFQQCDYFESVMLEPAIESLLKGFKYARQPYALAQMPEMRLLSLSDTVVRRGEPITLSATISQDGHSNGEGIGIQATVDEPSWVNQNLTTQRDQSIQPATATIPYSATIETSSLSLGQHREYIEFVDGAGNTGITYAVDFIVIDDTSLNYIPYASRREDSLQR